jgi:Macrocin-O-methyltransferase (TylF)
MRKSTRAIMQHAMSGSSSSFITTPRTIKYPTQIITYGWGERYVDVLLTFTLPALLAPGNLPYVASEVPCELIILTQRRFFPTFNRHPVIARLKELCPVRLIKLDDLIVSKDKYGMTLTYALHRGFSDLGARMTEYWQIFLNADFILADGSLRTVIGHLARGWRIVASPSYCTVAEEVIPHLRQHFDPATSRLTISHRELAQLILQHRHTVVRGKTVNQSAFHMRYADQFYWSLDENTLLGYQMPVSIVGLRPERYVAEPNAYWDYGLIWEYCPQAAVCVIGDSDEFTMLELRDRSVAEDQIVSGPANKKEIAERMVTWVTPYQQHFLKFPLTLHARDLPPDTGDALAKLQSFVDEVMSHAPALPSHIKHFQWEYHWAAFQNARRMTSRFRAGIQGKFTNATSALSLISASAISPVSAWARAAGRKAFAAFQKARNMTSRTRAWIKAKFTSARLALNLISASAISSIFALTLVTRSKASETCRRLARAAGTRLIRPLLRRAGLEIVKSTSLYALSGKLNENTHAMMQYKHQMDQYKYDLDGYTRDIQEYRREISEYKHALGDEKEKGERELGAYKRALEDEREKHEHELGTYKRGLEDEKERREREIGGYKRAIEDEREQNKRHIEGQTRAIEDEREQHKRQIEGWTRAIEDEREQHKRQIEGWTRAIEDEREQHKRQIEGWTREIEKYKQQIDACTNSVAEYSRRNDDLSNCITEYQLKLERSYDYQTIMAQEQIRLGMSNLEFEFLAFYEQCRQYTMTSWERLYALYKSVHYVVENKIPGDIVECGVWRGGSMKLVAQVLCALGVTDRSLFLYDTFEGMTEPDPALDVDASGNKAFNDWLEIQRRGVKWSYASVEEAREVIAASGYPMDKVVFVKGPVEDTIPATLPDRISLLRLDTDWYASTRHEIEHLYPRLSMHGILLLDDYGHYKGAQRAIDEYFDRTGRRPFLNRIDYSCRAAIKSHSDRRRRPV